MFGDCHKEKKKKIKKNNNNNKYHSSFGAIILVKLINKDNTSCWQALYQTVSLHFLINGYLIHFLILCHYPVAVLY